MKRILIVGLLLFAEISFAGEGMWLPQLLKTLNEADMKKQGLKISADDIYSINKGSLKDAIVSFGGFCTAEVISGQGLILTNHHCGFDAIQNQSSLQSNYIRDGFWAKNFKQELPNKGLTATFIVRIDDITEPVLKGITDMMNETTRQFIIDENIAAAKQKAKKESYQNVLVKPFFEGNKYYLFVTETYKDVRLVGAPPSSIGNFGKDTDNWMWPRHTGDFSLFRIYAGKDNKPADYSPDNVPYKPKRFLNISLDGVRENDFTMVFGFPGKTMEYLPAVAVEQIMNVNDPAKIGIRGKSLKILNDFMRKDEQIKIQYAAKYASIENAYKKWQGEVLGLKKKDAVGKKRQYEAEFQKRVDANPEWKEKYGTVLADLENAYKQLEPYSYSRDYYNEIISKIEFFTIANQLSRVATVYQLEGDSAYHISANKALAALKDIFHEYSATVDQRMFIALMEMFIKDQKPEYTSEEFRKFMQHHNNDYAAAASFVFSQSKVDDSTQVYSWLKMSGDDFVKYVKQDVGIIMLKELQNTFNAFVGSRAASVQSIINQLQQKYMQAQMQVFKEKKFYPDANSTLRVTYGKAKGYQPRDAVEYGMYTYLDGVMAKYVPGDYEFDVPLKLIDLYKKKDYGRYGVNGKQPVCFIATNHTTGGNSGSPALDAYGNLVGLNFDRVWEGTMSDINYDPEICRNIMVDIRYVAFIIDKFANAQNIINELKFVHPKQTQKK